jgi:sodium-independent sulfate anion transporter 11
MGTSKGKRKMILHLITVVLFHILDLSTGPTSILGLLTADIVKQLMPLGFSPQTIASAVALMVGVYAMFLGFFKLGFLLDYVSAPILSGFISAAALVIIGGQIPSLLGLTNVGSGTAATIHDTLTMLSKISWQTFLIGASGIVILLALQILGQMLGKKSKIIWAISICRAAIVVVLFTGISFAVNRHHKKKPVFAISAVTVKGIEKPRIPEFVLLKEVAVRAIAPLIAASLEHIAIGKEFASRNNYRFDENQELTYLGLTNFFNSWFGAMTVGGALSRTAVNDSANVKSPLSGLFTAGFVLLGIYKLSGALFWVPKATLAAIIVVAVVPLFVGPAKNFAKWWRTSFADFVACMICFWTTLFMSAEAGIGFAVFFTVGWRMVLMAFSSVRTITTSCALDGSKAGSEDILLCEIPNDTKVFRFEDSIVFANASRVKDAVLDVLQVYHEGCGFSSELCKNHGRTDVETGGKAHRSPDRSWSVAHERRIMKLRKRAFITSTPPCLRIVVLDFAKVSDMDTTGVIALSSLRKEIRSFGGEQCEVRFVNLDDEIRRRFERFGWAVRTEKEMEIGDLGDDDDGSRVVIYNSLAAAVGKRFNAAWNGDEKGAVEVFEAY